MNNCDVAGNCNHRYECDFCSNYSDYLPIDKKIKSRRQIVAKQLAKETKKEKKSSDASKRGKANKRNGRLSESELKRLLLSWGLQCDKVPLSGALKSSFTVSINGVDTQIKFDSDLWVNIRDKQYRIENKRRMNINKFYKLVNNGDVVHIEGFCYIMAEDIFRSLLTNVT